MATTIFYTYYQSPVGLLKIAGTHDCITEVTFRESIEHPEDQREEMTPALLQCTEQLIEYFNGQRREFVLPLNQRGTPFQLEVWNELMNIPFGKTISYFELARRTGDTKAIRAVGAANGKNNIAIIVPCHRVIGSNRQLVGYAGGLKRKKWLLDHELKLAHGVQTLF
jgi:methylated-DNA-[protein]-cysteine S-methyltransferase